MSASVSRRRVPARLLAGVTAAIVLGLMQGGPAARQGCIQQPMTRHGGNTTAFGQSQNGTLSADGRYIGFDSYADLDGDLIRDVFVYDRATCTLELVSVDSSGVKGNAASERPSISDDGRFVVFLSFASNLVASDANGFSPDAFVRDRQLGITSLVSVDSAGIQPATSSASWVRISGNGQVAAFVSSATTLVPNDTNDNDDIFVRDLVAGTTERVSISTTGQQGNSPFSDGVSDMVLSEDGRFIAFHSSMSTLVLDDFNNGSDVFVRDRALGTTVRASLNSLGAEMPGGAHRPAITADGRYVFFSSNTNLVAGNTGCDGIFIRDLVSNTTTCPNLDPFNASPSQQAHFPSVSGDGRYVAFTSFAAHYVPGDTASSNDVFVHDRTTGATVRINVSATGDLANSIPAGLPEMSADGRFVTFASSASNLVKPDLNSSMDVFVAEWGALPFAHSVNLMHNGSFAIGLQKWQTFATPDSSYIVTDTSASELRFYRVPPPPGTANQAVVFQQTGARLPTQSPLEARFTLGNSSAARKRISVLAHDADFTDLSVCTFWLASGAPMRDYVMRTNTTRPWTNGTISFYAATAGSDGGFYQVDNVSLTWVPLLDEDRTDCIDPTAPAAPGGAPGPTFLTNGDFSTGLAPWATFGQITSQITNSVFEFVRTPGTPAGVVLQATGAPLAPNDILTALFYLGNSSSVRKRVTLILHDQDFSDLSACTVWLGPNQPLAPYFMRTFATKAWTNVTFSLYPATVGPEEWIRFTDATLQVTPGTTPLGTECLEPGADSVMIAERGLQPLADRVRALRTPAKAGAVSTLALDDAVIAAHAVADGPSVIWQRTLDLGSLRQPALTFQSQFTGDRSTALAQVSLDGTSWLTVANLPATADWTTIDLDLSAFAGNIVQVRLVFDAAEPPPGLPPDRWRVRHVRLHRRR